MTINSKNFGKYTLLEDTEDSQVFQIFRTNNFRKFYNFLEHL